MCSKKATTSTVSLYFLGISHPHCFGLSAADKLAMEKMK